MKCESCVELQSLTRQKNDRKGARQKWGKFQRKTWTGLEVEVVCAYYAKRGALRSKEGYDIEIREGTDREELYNQATWRCISSYIDPI